MDASNADTVLRRLAELIGEALLTERLARLERAERQIYKDSAYVREWFSPQNIVWSVLRVARAAWSRGEIISVDRVPEKQRALFEKALYAAHVFTEAATAMDENRRTKLVTSLCASDEIKPVLLEYEAALFWARRGYRIEWLDDTGRDGTRIAELIARNADVEFAVECKAAGLDAGRRIDRKSVLLLVDELAARGINKKGHLNITIELDAFPETDKERTETASLIVDALGEGKIFYEAQGLSIEGELSARSGEIVEYQAFLEKWEKNQLDRFTYTTVLSSRSDVLCDPLPIRFVAPLKDRVTRNLKDAIRDAAAQLQATHRNGFVMYYLPEVSDFADPMIQEYLTNISKWLFSEGNGRDHIFACMFVSDSPILDAPATGAMPWHVLVNPSQSSFEALQHLGRP